MISKAIAYIKSFVFPKRATPVWLFRFDWKAYRKDFEYKRSGKHIVIATILLLFSDYFIETSSNVTNFLAENLNDNSFVNAFFYYILPIYLVIIVVNRLKKEYVPTVNALINIAIYTTLYIVLVRLHKDYAFVPVDKMFKYVDILFIGSIIMLTRWSIYFKRSSTGQTNYQFLTDKKNEPDLFGYKGLSKELTKFIHNTEADHSIAIGILGNWGDGKTFIANQIQHHFEEFRNDYIVIDFNPWLYPKEQLIEVFFKEFISATSGIDRSLKNDFISYIDRLTDQSTHEKIQLTRLVFKLLGDDRSTDKIKRSISEKIRLSKKKILVFIDDTDRLDANEIHEVLKIMRNCANFTNTFFIAGIDYNYIDSNVSNPRYLEKIFNVLVALPKVSESTLKNEIKNRIELHFPQDQDVSQALDELLKQAWFVYFVRNLRQLNRIINSFKIAYNKLRGNVDVVDLIILEMLKGSATSVYFGIFNDEILKYNPLTFSVTHSLKDAWKIKIDDEKDINSKEEIKDALSYLAHRKAQHMRSFSKGYHLLYFNYATNGVNIIEFYQVIDKEENEIITQFNTWLSMGDEHWNDLLQLVTLHFAKDIAENHKTVLPILLSLDDYGFSTRVFRDIYLPHINQDNDLTKDFFNLLFDYSTAAEKKPWTVLTFTSDIAKWTLNKNKDEASKADLEKSDEELVQKIYRTSFERILRSSVTFEQKYNSFKNCIIKIQDNLLQYDAECISKFRNHAVEDKQHLKDLLKLSVLPFWNEQYNDSRREIIIQDFLFVIFPHKEQLLDKISELLETEVAPLIKLLEEHADEYYEHSKMSHSYKRYIQNEELHKELLQYFNREQQEHLV